MDGIEDKASKAVSTPLIDTLPPGAYYDDPSEAPLIEDLRAGYLTMQVSVPMRAFRRYLLMALASTDPPRGYAPWAELRYHLQESMYAHVMSLIPPDMTKREPVLLDVSSLYNEDVPDGVLEDVPASPLENDEDEEDA